MCRISRSRRNRRIRAVVELSLKIKARALPESGAGGQSSEQRNNKKTF